MRSFIVASLSALAVACGGCGGSEPAARADTPVAVSGPQVVFHGTHGDVVVSVEIADDDRERAQGLMNRRELAPDHGMVFIFPSERVQSFWMKNTLIPLDMIFVDRELKIVGIVENAEPLTLTDRSVGVPSMYVIEVNGGFSRENGIAAGGQVGFSGVL